MNTLESIFKRVSLFNLFSYEKELSLSSLSDSAEKSFTTNRNDFFCFFPYITLIDAAGRQLDISEAPRNQFLVEVKVGGKDFKFGDKPLSIEAWNSLFESKQFNGIAIAKDTNVQIKIIGQSNPSTAVNAYPVTARFVMVGYELGASADFKHFRNQQNLEWQFGYPIQLSATSRSYNSENTTESKTIRIGDLTYCVTDLGIVVSDAAGKVIVSNNSSGEEELRDEFLFSLQNNHGKYLLRNIPLHLLPMISDCRYWRGFVCQKQSDMTIEIKGSSNVTSSRLALDAVTESFTVGDTVTGGTSSATGVVAAVINDGAATELVLTDIAGTFQDNETVTGAVDGSATSNIPNGIDASASNYPLTIRTNMLGYRARS